MYWRLRRLLLQDDVKKKCISINRELSNAQLDAMLRRWFVEDLGTVKVGDIKTLCSNSNQFFG